MTVTVTRYLQQWVKSEIQELYEQGFRSCFESTPSGVIRDKMAQQGFMDTAAKTWWSDSINLEHSPRRRRHFLETWLDNDIRLYEMFNEMNCTSFEMPAWGTRGT